MWMTHILFNPHPSPPLYGSTILTSPCRRDPSQGVDHPYTIPRAHPTVPHGGERRSFPGCRLAARQPQFPPRWAGARAVGLLHTSIQPLRPCSAAPACVHTDRMYPRATRGVWSREGWETRRTVASPCRSVRGSWRVGNRTAKPDFVCCGPSRRNRIQSRAQLHPPQCTAAVPSVVVAAVSQPPPR